MLPKSYRLPHTIRLSKGQSFRHSLFLLKFSSNTIGVSRFGVIVSKKIDKSAVGRNRMRRLLHAFIQENLSIFPSGYDYLFIVTNRFEKQPVDLAKQLQTYFTAQQR